MFDMRILKPILVLLVVCLCIFGIIGWLLCKIPLGKFQNAELKRKHGCFVFKSDGQVCFLPDNTGMGSLTKSDGKWIFDNLGSKWEVHPSVFKLEMIPLSGWIKTNGATNLTLKRIFFVPSKP